MSESSFGAIDRADLLRLYELALDQYRMEVQLNWERMKYFIVLTAGALSIAAALQGLHRAAIFSALSVLVLVAGFLISRLGRRMIRQGHEYTRVTMFKALLVARDLGLMRTLGDSDDPFMTYAVGTTSGMREGSSIFESPSKWVKRPIKPDNVTARVRLVLTILGAINLVAAVALTFGLLNCPWMPGLCQIS